MHNYKRGASDESDTESLNEQPIHLIEETSIVTENTTFDMLMNDELSQGNSRKLLGFEFY